MSLGIEAIHELVISEHYTLRHVNGTDLASKPPLILVGLEFLHCIVVGDNVGVKEIFS
jgi:hypothetical protein